MARIFIYSSFRKRAKNLVKYVIVFCCESETKSFLSLEVSEKLHMFVLADLSCFYFEKQPPFSLKEL